MRCGGSGRALRQLMRNCQLCAVRISGGRGPTSELLLSIALTFHSTSECDSPDRAVGCSGIRSTSTRYRMSHLVPTCDPCNHHHLSHRLDHGELALSVPPLEPAGRWAAHPANLGQAPAMD